MYAVGYKGKNNQLIEVHAFRLYLTITLRSALRIEARTSRPMVEKKTSLFFLYTAYKSRGARYLLTINSKPSPKYLPTHFVIKNVS